MRVRPGCVLMTVMLTVHGGPVSAQADAHARAIARASCQSGKHSDAVLGARAAVEHDPDEIGPQMRLADALVDQGCYQEAVVVLEKAEGSHPRNSELLGKLRDVRSLVTEQTYIEGLTQAAEGAKLARNQLRCTRLADVTACDDALRSKPDDSQLLLAKGDALIQANRAAEAVTAYHRALQTKPGDEAVKAKLAAAEALQAQLQPAAPQPVVAANPTRRARAPKKPPTLAADAMVADRRSAPPNSDRQHLTTTPVTSVATLEPVENKTYSNDAPAGRTN
jgi:cytochrome c-type biogenesis protein CcmH/NrfG